MVQLQRLHSSAQVPYHGWSPLAAQCCWRAEDWSWLGTPPFTEPKMCVNPSKGSLAAPLKVCRGLAGQDPTWSSDWSGQSQGPCLWDFPGAAAWLVVVWVVALLPTWSALLLTFPASLSSLQGGLLFYLLWTKPALGRVILGCDFIFILQFLLYVGSKWSLLLSVFPLLLEKKGWGWEAALGMRCCSHKLVFSKTQSRIR